jgi:hypothetical protein
MAIAARNGRVRFRSPDGLAAPPGDYESWHEYMTAFEAADGAWRDAEAQRGLKALRLAPSLRVYQALLAGQPVPYEALDPRWRGRYPRG